MKYRFLMFVSLAGFSGCASSRSRNPSTPPLLSATCVNGMGENWELNLARDGRVVMRTWDSMIERPSRERRFRIQVEPGLMNEVQEVQFNSLPESIEAATVTSDDDTLTISVWEGAKPHSASLLRHQESRKPEEAARFMHLWAIILEVTSRLSY